jgi:hypothetical protein
MKANTKILWSLFFLLTFLSSNALGQSLVMSGNEIFEQDAIAPKNKASKAIEDKIDLKVQQKKGKPILIPSLKNDKNLPEADKKPKVSEEKNTKGQKFTSLAELPLVPLINRDFSSWNVLIWLWANFLQ